MNSDVAGVKSLFISPNKMNAFVKQEIQGIAEERDFVSKVKEYIRGDYHQGLLITGIRSTGKTVGVLQAIPSDVSAFYFSPVYRGVNLDLDALCDMFSSAKADVWVLDEYSWINDPDLKLANYLAGQAKLGKKIIITGTDSAKIHSLVNSEFVHRAIELHTTVFTYDEFKRLYHLPNNQETMKRYLSVGGIFETSVHENFGSLQDFIKNAVLDNLSSYYTGFDPVMIKACVYTIFYDCVCNLFGREGSEVPVYGYDTEILSLNEYLERIGIDPAITIDNSVLSEIAHKLSEIDIVFTINDYKRRDNYRSYITNPCLSYQLTKAVFNQEDLSTGYLGRLYEAAVVCSTYVKYVKSPANGFYETHFLFGRKNRENYEIDLILCDPSYAYIIETKMSHNDDFTLSDNASIVKDIIPSILGDLEIGGRYVIYQGKEKAGMVNGKNIIYTNNWGIDFKKTEEHLERLKSLPENDDGIK